jgi:hypothetical protein
MSIAKKIIENFNLMSDLDFKSWFLNTDIINEEKVQIEQAFEEGMFHHINGFTPSEYYEENYEKTN